MDTMKSAVPSNIGTWTKTGVSWKDGTFVKISGIIAIYPCDELGRQVKENDRYCVLVIEGGEKIFVRANAKEVQQWYHSNV